MSRHSFIPLIDLINAQEEWLMGRILHYAVMRDYARYTSTLEEAWRLSIAGLSSVLTEALGTLDDQPELGPDEDYTKDPIASFGILEAKRHRSRGITLGMFLGLMKYYRQSYIDLIAQAGFRKSDGDRYRMFIERAFDRMEIGFCVEWAATGGEKDREDLRALNRAMTNEKNKYLTLFESAPTPVILLNTENLVDSLNHSAAELIYGIETPGFTYYGGQKTSAPLPWKIKETDRFFAGNNMEHTFEKKLKTKKGTRLFQVRLKRMLDVSGKFSGVELMLNDITEQKKAEAALRRSEKNLAAFFNTINDFLFVLDMKANMLTVNATVVNRLGYKKKELIGKSVLMVHPAERHPEAIMAVKAILEGETAHCEIPLCTADGKLIPVETRVVRGTWNDMDVLFGVSKDISDIKLSEEKFAKTFHASSTLMTLTTLDEGRFIDVNDAFLSTMGFSRGEVMGKTSKDLDIIADPLLRRTLKNELKDKGRIRNREISLKAKNGEIRYELISVEPFHVQDNIFILTTMNDITGMKMTEKEKEKLIEELREALAQVKTLSGLIPICAECKKIRNDKGYWQQIETYLRDHSDARFTHGYCPECAEKIRKTFRP